MPQRCRQRVLTRAYDRGRFAAKRENGVHHFQSLVTEFLSRDEMRARAAALLRSHPLLTPLLIVYGGINILAVGFEAPLSHLPVNLVLLVAYIALIHFATQRRPLAAPAVQRPDARSRDIRLAVTVVILQFAGVAIYWFVIPHGLAPAWSANLKGAGVPSLVAGRAVNAAVAVHSCCFRPWSLSRLFAFAQETWG